MNLLLDPDPADHHHVPEYVSRSNYSSVGLSGGLNPSATPPCFLIISAPSLSGHICLHQVAEQLWADSGQHLHPGNPPKHL